MKDKEEKLITEITLTIDNKIQKINSEADHRFYSNNKLPKLVLEFGVIPIGFIAEAMKYNFSIILC